MSIESSKGFSEFLKICKKNYTTIMHELPKKLPFSSIPNKEMAQEI